jgi:UDP:flavonoid glycosyltransferase YjiC (YdhE family)
MPYALFTAIPFVGHLNPLVREAQELQSRGWRVAIASYRELAPHLAREGPGIAVVDLGPLGPVADRLRACEEAASADPDYTRGAMRMLPALTEIWPSMYDRMTAAIAADKPDVVVADIFSPGGYLPAMDAGVPLAINNPALLSAVQPALLPPAPHVPPPTTARSIHEMRPWHRALEPLVRGFVTAGLNLTLGREVNRWRARRGLPRLGLARVLRGQPILVNGVFGLEYTRALPSFVHMIGPVLPADPTPLLPETAAWLAAGPPVVYANLGTVSRAPASQLAKMAEAFASEDFRVLWVVRDVVRDRLPAVLASNIRVVNWIESPRAVLAHPNVRVFVSHCGINSVYESMMAGTPVVGIPMLSDQRDMAARVADAGVGLWMDKTRFTAAELRAAIDRVRHESVFCERIAPIQRACASAGGVRRAADLIEAQARMAYRVEMPSSEWSAQSSRAEVVR